MGDARLREEVMRKVNRLCQTEGYIDGKEEVRKEVKGLLKQVDDIDNSELSQKARMRLEIEKQIGNED